MKEKLSGLPLEINTSTLDDKQKLNLLDSINNNTLTRINVKEELKKKIEKLNFKFYLETDKFLNLKTEIEKSQDSLFLTLFKQISLYIEEIDRLNNRIKEKEDNEKLNKNKFEVIISKHRPIKKIHITMN
jgi:hypothetical protein